jgi:hypothetical protein
MSFLSSLLDPELGLVKQNPDSKDYWLCPDNMLAQRALKATEAGRIIGTALARRAGVKAAGKFTPLLETGGAGAFLGPGSKAAFFETDLVTVSRTGTKRERTEVRTSRKVERWNEQADHLFIAAAAEKDRGMGRAHFYRALRMWDGVGFLDKSVFHRQSYSAETLGLALLAAGKVSVDLPIRPRILAQLALQQDASGGFAPDFDKDGKAAGLPSAKTTSVILLGLAAGP